MEKYRINKKKIRTLSLLLAVFFLLIVFQRWEDDSAEKYAKKADSRLASGDYNGALKDYYYVDKLDNRNAVSYYAKIKRAEIFMRFGKYDEAEAELLDAKKEDRRNYKAYELLGDLSGKRGEFDKAIVFFNNAIQYNDGPQAYLRTGIKRARAFLSKGEADLALNILNDLYEKAPDGKNSDDLMFYLGVAGIGRKVLPDGYLKALEMSEEYKERAEKVSSFIEKYGASGNEIFVDVAAASLFNDIGEPYVAISRADKAVKSDENYRDAWIVLGKSHFIIGDYVSSLKDFKKAISLDPHNEEIHFWIGSIFEKTGNEALANEHFGIYRDLKK